MLCLKMQCKSSFSRSCYKLANMAHLNCHYLPDLFQHLVSSYLFFIESFATTCKTTNFIHNTTTKIEMFSADLVFPGTLKKNKKNRKIKNDFFIIKTNEKANCSN